MCALQLSPTAGPALPLQIPCPVQPPVRLTVPGLEHAVDEELDEALLRLGYGAGGAVEDGHHHRQAALLLHIRLPTTARYAGKHTKHTAAAWNVY